MASEISAAMRDILILHCDQNLVPVCLNTCALSNRQRVEAVRQNKSKSAALRRGWLRLTADRRFTVITDDGRAILAKALADWGDALDRANRAAERRFGDSREARQTGFSPHLSL